MRDASAGRHLPATPLQDSSPLLILRLPPTLALPSGLQGAPPRRSNGRQPRDGADAGSDRLLRGEASFLLARAGEQEEAREVVRRVAESGSAEWGAFLVPELWAAESGDRPAFVG
jgi:hypothetical protein